MQFDHFMSQKKLNILYAIYNYSFYLIKMINVMYLFLWEMYIMAYGVTKDFK